MLSPMTKRPATAIRTTLSLHGQSAGGSLALCAAMALPAATEGKAPEWIHLLPAGEIRTHDGRGPYTVKDADAVIAASLQSDRGMVLDENHSTDLAAPKGEPAPARGWIVALEKRHDGIWGKVEWNATGLQLMAEKAYRHISPVIEHTKAGVIVAIARASLINKPNLRGLTALQMETDMDFLAKLRAALKLDESTSEDAVLAAVTSLHADSTSVETALQAQLAPLAKAAGLAEDADAATVATKVTALAAAGGGDATVTALQAELATVTTRLNTLTQSTARDKATAFVDAAIAAKRVGVSPLRDHYISMHMRDPARVEKEIGAMPILGSTHTAIVPPVKANGKGQLSPEQRLAISLMGIDEEAYQKTLAAEAATAEAAL